MTTAMVYHIRDWSQHFENNRTRDLKELRFVIFPNRHDGDGYTELLDHPNGAAHYGAWCVMVQVASRGQHPAGGCGIPAGCCECRGILLRDGARPHDSVSLSRLTRIPSAVFEEAIPRLLSIGWLDVNTPQPSTSQIDSAIPQGGATSSAAQSRRGVRDCAASIEWNGREGNGIEGNSVANATALNIKPDLLHPAVVLYREICSYKPNDQQQVSIISLVTNLDLYRDVLVQFMREGRPPKRVDWTLERYEEGLAPARGRNPDDTYVPPTPPAPKLSDQEKSQLGITH